MNYAQLVHKNTVNIPSRTSITYPTVDPTTATEYPQYVVETKILCMTSKLEKKKKKIVARKNNIQP
jgi:hypothetical protein